MMRSRFLSLADKAMATQIILIVAGSTLAFGGAVWWMKPALGIATVLLCLTWLARTMLTGRLIVLRSPLTFLGLAALGLAAVQLTPMPGRLASIVSPRARAVHALGTIPDLARADDPSVQLPEAVADKTPATLDRSATLRWFFGAAACLAIFCACSHYADRSGRSAIIWGSVIGAFFVGTTFGVAQILGGVSGLYGAIEPGSGRPATPSLDDLANVPGPTALRPVGDVNETRSAWNLPRAGRRFLFGSLLGGPGAYLAMGSLALPLAMGVALQLLAPRGSRESLRARMRDSGRTGLLILLLAMTWTSAILIGYLAGPTLAIPYVFGIVVAGLPAAWSSGLRWLSVLVTAATLGALGVGIAAGQSVGRQAGLETIAPGVAGWAEIRAIWRESLHAAKDFPLVGTGLGTFPTIASYYKGTDETFTTARSSLLQWFVETGLVGAAIVAIGGLWCVVRLPRAVRSVGTADRTMAFTMIGTLACFAMFSALHWSVELLAVAIAACAVGGTCNRWLSGGTDLFVERA